MRSDQHADGWAWTWEPAAALISGFVAVVLFAVQLGRSIALFLVGEGWWWPPAPELATSAWGIVTGDVYAGLPATGATGPTLTWIIATILSVAGLVAAAVVGYRLRAAARHKGMATRQEAEQLLGLSRLRANKKVIRPDLHNTTRTKSS